MRLCAAVQAQCLASDMYDTVFKGLAPPCISDGTLPRCVLLVGTGQEDGLEDVAHTCDGVGLGDHGRVEGAHGVAYPCVWNDSTFFKMNNYPLMVSSKVSTSKCKSRLRRSASQEGCPPLCPESDKTKFGATALITQMHHFDGYTYSAKGWQFLRCVTTTLLR